MTGRYIEHGNSLFVDLISSANGERYPDNTMAQFTTSFDRPLGLDGGWKAQVNRIVYPGSIMTLDDREQKTHRQTPVDTTTLRFNLLPGTVFTHDRNFRVYRPMALHVQVPREDLEDYSKVAAAFNSTIAGTRILRNQLLRRTVLELNVRVEGLQEEALVQMYEWDLAYCLSLEALLDKFNEKVPGVKFAFTDSDHRRVQVMPFIIHDVPRRLKMDGNAAHFIGRVLGFPEDNNIAMKRIGEWTQMPHDTNPGLRQSYYKYRANMYSLTQEILLVRLLFWNGGQMRLATHKVIRSGDLGQVTDHASFMQMVFKDHSKNMWDVERDFVYDGDMMSPIKVKEPGFTVTDRNMNPEDFLDLSTADGTKVTVRDRGEDRPISKVVIHVATYVSCDLMIDAFDMRENPVHPDHMPAFYSAEKTYTVGQAIEIVRPLTVDIMIDRNSLPLSRCLSVKVVPRGLSVQLTKGELWINGISTLFLGLDGTMPCILQSTEKWPLYLQFYKSNRAWTKLPKMISEPRQCMLMAKKAPTLRKTLVSKTSLVFELQCTGFWPHDIALLDHGLLSRENINHMFLGHVNDKGGVTIAKKQTGVMTAPAMYTDNVSFLKDLIDSLPCSVSPAPSPPIIEMQYSPQTLKITMRMRRLKKGETSPYNVVILKLSAAVSRILGLNTDGLGGTVCLTRVNPSTRDPSDAATTKDLGEWPLPLERHTTFTAPDVMDLYNGVHTMFLYCDLVENHFVGNGMSNVLFKTRLQRSPGEMAFIDEAPYNPTAVQISRAAQTVERMTIYCRDHLDRPIRFMDGSGDVHVTLHFFKHATV